MKYAEQIKYLEKILSRQTLAEASLSRILRHIDDSEGFGIISAERSELSAAENTEATQNLRQDIRSLGLGFIRLKGGWVETVDKDTPNERKIAVEEISHFVPKIQKDDIHRLGNKYGQEGVVWGDGNEVFVVNADGSEFSIGTSVSLSDFDEVWSSFKGRQFKFEGFTYQPSGSLDALAWGSTLRRLAEDMIGAAAVDEAIRKLGGKV